MPQGRPHQPHGVYWTSYADYLAHNLSVDFKVSNMGTDFAYAVQVTGSTANNGVVCTTAPPVSLGTITAGGNHPVTLKYAVPADASSFLATVSATALDGCSGSYSYPEPSAAV